ncbi:MAG TPA: MBL fold metallo-hydrolase [Chloroflexota bacterium]|nr:MBL fold metallo-hydrolase [Chloroflexota bacterium]
MYRLWRWIGVFLGSLGILVSGVLGPGWVAGHPAAQRPEPAAAEPLPILRLGEGIYAVKGPGDDMNTGVVVGDDGVFVFGCNLRNYEQRLAAIRTVTDKPIRWAANGHMAFDDSGCNWELRRLGAALIGSSRMREHYLEWAPPRLALELTRPEGQRVWQGRGLAPPEITFDDRLVLHLGEGREAHLLYAGHGHTIGDALVYLPEQRVLFTADLLFVRVHPTVRDGDSVNWQRILERLMTWEIAWIVPGHGDIVQGKTELQTLWTYWETMRARVQALMRQGKSIAEIQAEIELGEYASWARPETVPETVEKLYHELLEAGA